MRTAYCEHCNDLVQYRVETSTDVMTVRGVSLSVEQDHAFCEVCGAEIYPATLDDSNIDRAHNAYRKAIGVITTTRIEELLKLYNVGAEPLSLLIGWGKNTLSRQTKDSVPSAEHSKVLESLFDNRKMRGLLRQNGERITNVAYRKILERLDEMDREREEYSTLKKNKGMLRPRYPVDVYDSAAKYETSCSDTGGPARASCPQSWFNDGVMEEQQIA